MKHRHVFLLLLCVALSACGGSAPKRCVVGGCSGQLCIEEDGFGVTNCMWSESYACYKDFGKCERQPNGNCGWSQTPELKQCLDTRGKELPRTQAPTAPAAPTVPVGSTPVPPAPQPAPDRPAPPSAQDRAPAPPAAQNPPEPKSSPAAVVPPTSIVPQRRINKQPFSAPYFDMSHPDLPVSAAPRNDTPTPDDTPQE
jgi:hypothetical protein